MTKACLKNLNDGESIAGINNTVMCLIPKVNSVESITNFRPISLCNVIYKIVAKALENRLRNVIGEVISEEQSAFVPSRLITENAIIGFECLHSLRTRSVQTRAMALKLDMSKAYDKVDWNFLAKVMGHLGFVEA
ncbi:hypothetical protein Dsin_009031 [Dipteronia sinensis]|uniref:Reverse transcriptase domain-containing protein n=1 Tax=Dipteronia sinensis TaxID=43782 RepID=A0AAE0EBD2_9ROSI|nr:hypothetical protein Dsin_009031 [Dipteronia sinensis]